MIRMTVSEDAQEAARRYERLPATMAQAVRRAMDAENQLTVGHIQASKLSRRGKTTLGVITNRLRGSARATQAEVHGDRVESSIGTSVRYGAVHEYGFRGTQSVRAHRRRTPAGDRFRLGARDNISRRLAGRLGLFDRRGLLQARATQTASGTSQVRAHTRSVNFPARAMFRRGIEERADRYGAAISRAIVEAATQS